MAAPVQIDARSLARVAVRGDRVPASVLGLPATFVALLGF
jgi:hypothetical protein